MSIKYDKFRDLAENRVNKTVKMIDLIGNLSNSRNYEYTEEDVRKIFGHIDLSIQKAKAKFKEQLDKKKTQNFKL